MRFLGTSNGTKVDFGACLPVTTDYKGAVICSYGIVEAAS